MNRPMPNQKPKAIIVDVDGTIALMNGKRGPFDWKKVGVDDVNKPIATLVNILNSFFVVILVSGRDGSCEVETRKWLSRKEINYDILFMRPTENYDKDVLIKKNIYNKYIKDEYDVQFVLDDRDQTVKGWRELGLTCLQVAEGNF